MAFDERIFINKKRGDWEQLSRTVERIKSSSLRNLPRQELLSVGALYRRAAADLSYARAQGANPSLILYLNELVGNAHGTIYAEPSNGWAGIGKFLWEDLPAVLRKRMPFILAAFGITMLGALFAYVSIRVNPASQDMFIPAEFKDSFDAWKQGFSDHGDIPLGEGSMFSSALMTNNTNVGIIAFATGITIVLPVYFMFSNGENLGALVAVVQPTHHLTSMWSGILPHGVCELSAIFICGGAGFLIAWAIISPGRLSRRDALVANGREACMMMVGTVPMFIIAGIIEGNISHSSLPHFGKFGLAAVQFILLMAYIYAPRRAVARPAMPRVSAEHYSHIIERALSSK